MEIWGGSHAANTSVSTPGLDFWIYSRPHEQSGAGGDVHYVSLCGGGVITRFILADVSGHGASAADMARSLRELMRRNINRKSHTRLVKELNRQFSALAEQRRFATAVVGTYLATDDRLTICNAGHPRPFWYRADAGKWLLLAGTDGADASPLANLPLGVDDSTTYPQSALDLARGDLALIYTDALTEGTDAGGRQLGEGGLFDLVRQLDVAEPAKVAEGLIQRLDGYRQGRAPDDDLTFLLLHRNAGGPARLSLRQKLDVYAKVFGLKSV
jgi:serine phosphatase RsbU (regulator of sigma subunit)